MDRWWRVVNVPVGSTGLPWELVDGLLGGRFPGYRFSASSGVGDGGHRDPVVTVRARPGTDPPADPANRGPDVHVVVEDGPDAGHVVPLSRSGITVGRNGADWRISDPYLSSPHFSLTVEPEGVRVTDLTAGPRTGAGDVTWWDGRGPHTAGSSEFRLARGRPAPLAPGTRPPDAVVDPGPDPARPHPLLQAVMAVGPLAIGVVMAVVTGYWYFLLFSMVSVVVVGVLWMQHRAATRRHRRRIRDRVLELGARLDALTPSPGRVALAARSGAPDRFATSTGAEWSPDGPVIRWGRGTTRLPLRPPSAASGHVARGLGPAEPMPAVSVLTPGRSTIVTGHPTTLVTVAHWLRVQLYRDSVATGRPVLIRTPWGETGCGAGSEAHSGTVLCGPGTSDEGVPETWHRVLLTDIASSNATTTQQDAAVPMDVMDMKDLVEPDAGRARLGDLQFSVFRHHGMSRATADWLVEEMGALGPRPRGTGTDELRLPEPLFAASATDILAAPLTPGKHGVHLDLVGHGPHVLVAGTTGSGKSELLLSLLTGLAAAHPPAEVSFILMDFKGGSSFSALSTLPHTMSVETNLVETESVRTFDALAAELQRRERLFLEAGTADFRAYRSAHPGADLPRLVVAIDELRILVDEHPRAATLLARLSATGRSLGFHLLLATQRAQGAVGPDVRSNLGTVVCLRTATEQESWDLLGSGEAFTLPIDAPGSAVIKHGGGAPRRVHAARYAVPTGPPALVPWHRAESLPEPSPWPEVSALLRTRAEARGLTVPRPVVTPALPESWVPTPSERSAAHGSVVLGLADRPDRRSQGPVAWSPSADPPTAWIGTPTGGVDAAARTVLSGLLDRDTPAGDVTAATTVVLDGAGILDSAPAVPDHWRVLEASGSNPEALGEVIAHLRDTLSGPAPVTFVVTHWGRWASQRVGSGYETLEEVLIPLVRDHGPGRLSVALFGGRELAGSRLLGHVPVRFYLPTGTTPEHRLVWPSLRRVREVPGRAVMVSPDHPAPGIAVQLATPSGLAAPPDRPGQSAAGVSTTGTEA